MTRSTRRKTWLGVAGAGGVLALAIAVPSLAFAQDTTPTPSTSAAPNAGGTKTGEDAGKDRAARQDELATALAKELGVDKDKVAAALAKIESERAANRPKPDGTPRADGTKPDRTAELKARLATAVTAGTLTQAEADAIIKASEAGLLAGGPGGGQGGGQAGGPGGGHAPGK